MLNVGFYQSKSLVYYPVLPPTNGVFHHTMLTKVGIVLSKAVPWPPRLMVRWFKSESHSHRVLHNLRGILGFTPQLVVIQAKTHIPLGLKCMPGTTVVLEPHWRTLAWL